VKAHEVAERLCGLAEVPAQVVVVTARQRSTRLGAGVVLNNTDIELAEAEVLVLVDGAEGRARTTVLDDEGLKRALSAATTAARACQANPDHPGFASDADAGAPTATPVWDEATAVGHEGEGEAVGAAIDAASARGAKLAGLVLRRAEQRVVANTLGLSRSDRRTVAQASWIASCGAGGGFRDEVATRESDLHHAALAAEAADVAVRSADPGPIEPGTWDVVLSSKAVKDLLEWLASIGFGSRAYEDGTSFLAGRRDQKLTSSAVSIWDPGPQDPLPVGFDDEGCGRRRVDFLREGVALGPVWDRASAARNGTQATGHTQGGGLFPASGAQSRALHMAGGDEDDLLAGLKHGLYVERFHYVNGYLDPRRARMTGLTRDGLFEVRDGVIERAVGDLRFTENVLEAFSRIDGISRGLHLSPCGRRGLGSFSTPAVRIRGFQFTGSAARL
jgi:PmbA protein